MKKKAREKKHKQTVILAKGEKKEDSRSLDEYSQMVFVTLAFILWVEL